MHENSDKLDRYKKTLLHYYEEEVAGEAYFDALARKYDKAGASTKMKLLAQVERCAADVMKPLLEKYALAPRDDATLFELGIEQAAAEKRNWPGFLKHMIMRYPAYVDDFENLERMAPNEDLAPLKILTLHEVVAIDFAEMEITGDTNSTAPLRRYIKQYET